MGSPSHATPALMLQHAHASCQAVPDNPYTRFLSGLTRKQGKRGNGFISEIDEAPDALCDLAAYFASLPVGKLASCWVACLADAVDPAETGNIARALIVVAQRLHNVTFTTPDVPCPAQAIDGEHPMPFQIQTTTPPVDLKTAKKTPAHIRDAAETIRSAPMTWRWFVWENCPKAWRKPAKQLAALFPGVDVYQDAEQHVIVANAGSGPRIGPAPAPLARSDRQAAGNGEPAGGASRASNETGQRAKTQAPRVLAALREARMPMSVREIGAAMKLSQNPNAAVALLLDRGHVNTGDGPEGSTLVELTQEGEAEARRQDAELAASR